MKDKLHAKTLWCWLIFGAVMVSTSCAAAYADHERGSKILHEEMQQRLSKYAAVGDESGLRVLNSTLDAQLKLEEFLIKSREADHPKMAVWAPIVLTTIVSSVVSILTTLLTIHGGKHKANQHSSH